MVWGRASSTSDKGDWPALVSRLEAVLGVNTTGSSIARAGACVEALEERAIWFGDRSHRRHAATGIPTREPLLQRMREDGSGVLGIVRFLDFDRLCAFDPALGDELLLGVATRLRTMLPPERLLAHIDRAAVAIWFGREATEEAAACELGAIEYALGEALQIGERTVLPKVSSQVAIVRGEDPRTALARALARLVVGSGGIQAPATPDGRASDGPDDFALEQDLRVAMNRGQLRLCYQPLIEAAKGRVCGAEALMRWQHPDRGAVSPALFVPVMEAAGLAHEFGLWALNAAIRENRRWQGMGFGELCVAVNISGHQLERDDFPRLVQRTLHRHALMPGALEIELTEGVAMGDCDRAARLFAEIRAMGVAIAIDDFGTGYSSLSTLRKLAFDKIKIDREFVTEVDRRRDSQAICQSVIALARGLGIRVLAEGVERREEYAWLRAHGCGLFQGYYFSPPLEPTEFVAYLEDASGLAAKLAVDPRQARQAITKAFSA